MARYEIMAIVNPKSKPEVFKELLVEEFGKNIESIDKLERTKLAYKINNSLSAIYMLAYVNSTPEKIKHFNQQVNFSKEIWRVLIINLDKEDSKKKPKKMSKRYEYLMSLRKNKRKEFAEEVEKKVEKVKETEIKEEKDKTKPKEAKSE